MATIHLVDSAVGLDKFVILAKEIDRVAEQVHMVTVSLDDEVETLCVREIASRHGVTFETMRKQICALMGNGTVFRIGKCWVIRKRKFLDYLLKRERQEEGKTSS